MAVSKYVYNKLVVSARLKQEIEADGGITTDIDHMVRAGSEIRIWMADELSGAEETALDAVVTAHTATALPIDPEQYEESDTDTHETTESDYVVMESMSVTPAAGTYGVTLSGSGEMSSNNKKAYYALFIDDDVVAHSVRRKYNKKAETLFTQAELELDGTQTVEARFKISGGAFKVYERSLILRRNR